MATVHENSQGFVEASLNYTNEEAIQTNDNDICGDLELAKSDTEGGSTSTNSKGLVKKKIIDYHVPLVELELKNVTYAPTSIMHSAHKNKQRNSNKNQRIGSKKTVILDKVSTKVSPHKLTAWMGPSGSGKTSLISVAANLVASPETDILDGSLVLVNGEKGYIPKRLVGVVWQDDLLLSNLTVQENIYFAARLKTSKEKASDSDIQQIVEETMNELGILHIKDSIIGGGISGGERKRVSVASELVVRPSVLFLDEPTSGLDATTAKSLIRTLKDLATFGGHSIVVVIHQPRTEIFHLFDHLLLLSRGGKTVFDGPTNMTRSYLESIPTIEKLPLETGIADWIMDVIIEDEHRYHNSNNNSNDDNTLCIPSYWEDGKGQRKLMQLVQQHHLQDKKYTTVYDNFATSNTPVNSRNTTTTSTLKELHSAPRFVTDYKTQFLLLLKRSSKQQRGERITKTSLIVTICFTIFTIFFWWRLPDNTGSIYEKNSLLFFIIIAQSNSVVVSSLTTFPKERKLLSRERAKKLYAVLPYFTAKTISDMTNNVLLPCFYGVIIYFACGFRLDNATYFIKFFISYYLSLTTAQSMGILLSIAIPNFQIALMVAPAITLFFMIMGGFYIPLRSMHVGVKWITWLSFASYGYISMLVNEFSDRDIPCVDANNNEDIPAISIGGDFSCPLSGNQVLESLGIVGLCANYWFDIIMLIILQTFFRVASYGILRRSK